MPSTALDIEVFEKLHDVKEILQVFGTIDLPTMFADNNLATIIFDIAFMPSMKTNAEGARRFMAHPTPEDSRDAFVRRHDLVYHDMNIVGMLGELRWGLDNVVSALWIFLRANVDGDQEKRLRQALRGTRPSAEELLSQDNLDLVNLTQTMWGAYSKLSRHWSEFSNDKMENILDRIDSKAKEDSSPRFLDATVARLSSWYLVAGVAVFERPDSKRFKDYLIDETDDRGERRYDFPDFRNMWIRFAIAGHLLPILWFHAITRRMGYPALDPEVLAEQAARFDKNGLL